jgi:hypothetical protein
MMLTAERLRELLHYDPETGVFTSKNTGKVLGWRHGAGYTSMHVFGGRYLAHRLAWLYVNGEWPRNVIDHIDGLRTNNAISNLRDVSRLVNSQNMKRAMSNNKCGLLGVTFCTQTNRWAARIRKDGKKLHIGRFDTAQQAHEAYLVQKRSSHLGNTL